MNRPVQSFLIYLLTSLCLALSARGTSDLGAFARSGLWASEHGSVHFRGDAAVWSAPLATVPSRVTFDRVGHLNLSHSSSFALEADLAHPSSIRSVMLYLKSGSGWYACSAVPGSQTRQYLSFPRASFSSEGSPSGWNNISLVRIAFWKAEGAVNTTIQPRRLEARSDEVLIVQPGKRPSAGFDPAYGERVAKRVAQWLSKSHIGAGIVEDTQLASKLAKRSNGVVILPYNVNLQPAHVASLIAFGKRGGKLIICWEAPDALASYLGIHRGPFESSRTVGSWASLVATEAGNQQQIPKQTFNHAWTRRVLRPASADAATLATWSDGVGTNTGLGAVVQSPRGTWLAPTLISGDSLSKRRLLVALVAQALPNAWRNACTAQARSDAWLDGCSDLASSVARINAIPSTASARKKAQSLVRLADSEARRASEAMRVGGFRNAYKHFRATNSALLRAYAVVQPKRTSEWIGIWEHQGTGLYAGGWVPTAQHLNANGIDAVFANLAWGGKAHFATPLLPGSKTLEIHGDQLRASAAACAAAGVELHFWKVCWKLEGAEEAFVQRMRKAGRLLVGSDGKTRPWLCPVNAQNQALEIGVFAAAARNPQVSGLHLDYIRFPDRNGCYCTTCRDRFTTWLKRAPSGWPKSAFPGGALAASFERFRADQLTVFVQQLRKQVRAIRPGIPLSAAVFGKYPDCIHSVGQDWGRWLEKGLLEKAMPMNYTPHGHAFDQFLQTQTALPGAKGRIYPGIGVVSNEAELSPDQVMDQVRIARQRGCNGTVLFKLDPHTVQHHLPLLGAGLFAE